ncbi:MAG: MurR/RpiR family transcriptional regulator [Ilumatobacteraceae bacterium]
MSEVTQPRQMDARLAAQLEPRLRAARLTPAQRAVARFLLEHPDRLLFMSAAELAADVGVSQPSVTRLAKELGYNGYAEMIGDLRDHLQQQYTPSDDTPGANSFQLAVETEINALRSVHGRLAHPAPLLLASHAIVEADAVLLIGLRISSSLAHHFHYRLSRLRDNVRLATSGGSLLFDDIALTSRSARSVAVVFSMPRYPVELSTALQFARDRNMGVVQFIDTPTASLCAPADHVIVSPTSWGLTFGSFGVAHLLASLLIDAVASDPAGDSTRRLIDLESVAVAHDHYMDEGPGGTDSNSTNRKDPEP